MQADQQEWKASLRAPVRIQWDPERDIHLRPLLFRAIQMGLSGEAVDRYLDDWIVGITDVTALAKKIHGLVGPAGSRRPPRCPRGEDAPLAAAIQKLLARYAMRGPRHHLQPLRAGCRCRSRRRRRAYRLRRCHRGLQALLLQQQRRGDHVLLLGVGDLRAEVGDVAGFVVLADSGGQADRRRTAPSCPGTAGAASWRSAYAACPLR